ncbi:antirestriction protein [Legionella hackeliae]|uniref:antirestriction protein n=1 Tax=Legionella hackeliae TaxID=449 RepID=UPI001E2BBC83|nr:antirestriction protein [Legionella hackeliae]
MSADAAGIITTLCVLNQLCWKTKSDKTIQQYYLLRDYIEYHKEAADIYAAID